MRTNWLDEDTNAPTLEEQVAKLQHFMDSMADGIIDADELAKQSDAMVAAMEGVQNDLTDEQHAKVTILLVELTAFNIMKTLHELTASRLQGTGAA